ncbi:MAG: GNAT family N-acetyltransferase [Verrucomicrobiales bacterium]
MIRRASPRDADALTGIAFAAKRHWGYREAQIAAWAGQLTITPEQLRYRPAFVAESGGVPVGFSALRGGESGGWELTDLWVLPAFMGNGIGAALFGAARAHATARGGVRLSLESDPHAVGFYEEKMARSGIYRDPSSHTIPMRVDLRQRADAEPIRRRIDNAWPPGLAAA